MAENIINFVLSKLADTALEQVLDRHDEIISRHVQEVGFQLRQIQPFLKGADKKQIIDEKQKLWLREVRDVGYSIEDVIDIFLLDEANNIGFSTKRIETFAHGIGEILPRIVEIAESRVTYGINNLGEGSGEIRLPVRPRVLPNMDPDIIGFEAIRDHLVMELPDETSKRLCVVSIWGPGGLGKTTLALKLYNCNDSKRQFELRIWVGNSQNCRQIDIWEKIAPQLQPPVEAVGISSSKIRNSLTGKKYLIVLDDVTTFEWTSILIFFPNENNGSRVLMTTKLFEVAKKADPKCEPYKLEFLSKELSRELLLKQTFLNLDPNTSSFEHLNILDQFVHKCGGLPLALIVLGGLLLKMPQHNWHTVLQTMTWDVDGENCHEIITREIIATSYEYLPFVLKSCFLYFAAFPKNYDIDARSLLQMWIAEGFIAQEDNRTLEETAESFLEDLVHRGMVQVKSRDYDGSIEYIHIHDLLQDLALKKAKADNFLEVYSDQFEFREQKHNNKVGTFWDGTSSLKVPLQKKKHVYDGIPSQKVTFYPRKKCLSFVVKARRVAIHTPQFDDMVMRQNLRTLLCFGCTILPRFIHENLSLLKVVSIIGGKTEIYYKIFERSPQLRYVKLSGTLHNYLRINPEFYLKKVIGGMDFLETLDVKDLYHRISVTENGDTEEEFIVPDCVWRINTLRHATQSTITLGPPQSATLTNLQTISPMCIRQSCERLPYLPNLRILYLIHESLSSQVIFNFLVTLQHLTSLSVESIEYYLPSVILLDMIHFPFYEHLKSLTLRTFNLANHIETLHENMLPCHLTSLEIVKYNFQQDLMPVLEKLCCLKKLQLVNACRDKKMSCSSRGFSQLEFLSLSNLSMEKWEIEKGAMPILKELRIFNCRQLRTPHGLKYLTNLEVLMCTRLRSVDTDLIRNLCRHVHSLDIRE